MGDGLKPDDRDGFIDAEVGYQRVSIFCFRGSVHLCGSNGACPKNNPGTNKSLHLCLDEIIHEFNSMRLCFYCVAGDLAVDQDTSAVFTGDDFLAL